jgi:hypothetical protein
MKASQKRYYERIKGTEMYTRILASKLVSSKKAFNKRYANDEEFRKNKVAYGIEKYYYDSAEESCLKCVRKLFGKDVFYGR